NAVSALAYRARSGLRESYLQQHIMDDNLADVCGTHRDQMVGVVRGTAKQRIRERVFQHLEGCAECDQAFEHLSEVNRELGLVSMSAAVTVTGTATAGIAAGLAWMTGAASTLKAHLAAVLIPALTVGAVAVAPMIAQEPASASMHDPARHAATVTSVKNLHSTKQVAESRHSTAPTRSHHVGQTGVRVAHRVKTPQPSGSPAAEPSPASTPPLEALHKTLSDVVKGSVKALHIDDVATSVSSGHPLTDILSGAVGSLADAIHGH
ncbi:MAG: hypothetical protein QOJ72_1383, partial [Nocardioidaceae bacterium]|nr:hypothetical protein [Nocardioidaceae bacterium]